MTKPKRTRWRTFDEAQAKALADAKQPDRIYSLSTDGCTPTGIWMRATGADNE